MRLRSTLAVQTKRMRSRGGGSKTTKAHCTADALYTHIGVNIDRLLRDVEGRLAAHGEEVRREVMDVLRSIQEKDGVTVVIITHERDIAELTDRQVHLVDGRIDGDTKDGTFSLERLAVH